MCAQRQGDKSEGGKRSDQVEYLNADDLLIGLRGDQGPARHALALGYLMAIQDADADCVEGRRLLSNLRGDQGPELKLVASGYVSAVRDDLHQASAGDASTMQTSARPGLRSDAAKVRDWMERHPPRTGEMALPIVRAALEAAPARRSIPLAVWSAVRKLGRRWPTLSPSRAIPIAALAVVPLLIGLRHLETAPADEQPNLRSSLELSEVSSQLITLVLEERRFEKDSFINLQTQDAFTDYLRQWENYRRNVASLLTRVSKMTMSDQDRLTFEQISRDFQEYTRGYEAVVTQIRAGVVQTTSQANDAIGPVKGAAHRIETNGNAVRERAESRLATTL